MTQTFDYYTVSDRDRTKRLALYALANAVYPLLIAGTLFGQWALSWVMLGRQPEPSVDDPKFIEGAKLDAWRDGTCNNWFRSGWILRSHSQRHLPHQAAVLGGLLSAHLVIVIGMWLGVLAILHGDPGDVVKWSKD